MQHMYLKFLGPSLSLTYSQKDKMNKWQAYGKTCTVILYGFGVFNMDEYISEQASGSERERGLADYCKVPLVL